MIAVKHVGMIVPSLCLIVSLLTVYNLAMTGRTSFTSRKAQLLNMEYDRSSSSTKFLPVYRCDGACVCLPADLDSNNNKIFPHYVVGFGLGRATNVAPSLMTGLAHPTRVYREVLDNSYPKEGKTMQILARYQSRQMVATTEIRSLSLNGPKINCALKLEHDISKINH
ncbi:hypothetical protein BU17DRAFT_70777 [Hysterangium stoloniferum]|nr:hypothetical protein BU17DRAFT_70777 [Hysterangium stoloniferum]